MYPIVNVDPMYTQDLKVVYRNILSGAILNNMTIMKKKDVKKPEASLSIRYEKTDYIDDFPVIYKLDNS